MSVLINGMKMPDKCGNCPISTNTRRCVILWQEFNPQKRLDNCPLIELPPHGDLIDRDALMKDGWLNLHKEVMRIGGYAIHELPLKNPSIHVIIPAEEGE